MAKIATLFSGSTGNCTYISCGSDSILVDLGVSCKQILLALENNLVDPKSLKGIFITHSHSDHIKGLRVFLSKYNIPVFASKETLGTLLLEGVIDDQKNSYFDIEKHMDIPFDMEVDFFRTSHDCAGSGGFVFTLKNGDRAAICTDLGVISDNIKEKLLGCRTVVLESNHDVGMLENGPYPYELKQRVLGDEGHLSNATCSSFLPSLVKSGTVNIILAHLSRENNTPDIARVTAESVLMENKMKCDDDYRLFIAPPAGGKIIYF
ncbi:MAG: MBL fold metallo-hydrolase [Clostridia bacterium]|nr:MBL fold metallo-hydrolase [Clostridia bacterium]